MDWIDTVSIGLFLVALLAIGGGLVTAFNNVVTVLTLVGNPKNRAQIRTGLADAILYLAVTAFISMIAYLLIDPLF